MLTYHLSTQRQSHLFNISLSFNLENSSTTELYLANWTPGSYMIRDYAQNLISLNAQCDGHEITLTQTHKNTWLLPPLSGNVVIDYEIYAFDLSVRGAFLNNERGFFDGASLFMTLADFEDQACDVFLQLPKTWETASAAKIIQKDNSHHYHVANYAQLIDTPVEMGKNLERISFSAKGLTHEIVLSGDYLYLDTIRLQNDVKKICETHLNLFEKHPPFEHYVFLLHISDHAYGGLEHLSSTALLASRDDLPTTRHTRNSQEYTTLLGLFSHEYFHAWNIKSIRPQLFEHYDLKQEVHTEQLWAFEGITAYYDDLALCRSQVISAKAYLKLLASTVSKVSEGRGRLKQSLAESSFNAWTKFYKQNENAPNAIVSYYQKGALFALCLDAHIRQASDDKHSLNTVMHALYHDYAQTQKGIPEGEWQIKVSQLTGIDLLPFFERYLYRTEDLPLSEALHYFGLSLEFLAVEQETVLEARPEVSHTLAWGARYKETPQGILITQVFNNSHAAEILQPGDTVLAINQFGASDFKNLWSCVRVGETVTVHFLRKNKLHKAEFIAKAQQDVKACLFLEDKNRLQHWLEVQEI